MAEVHINSNNEKVAAKWCSCLRSNWLSDATSSILNSCSNNNIVKTMPAQQDLRKDANDVSDMFDCVVCMCEVAPEEEDGSKKLLNCDHGVQFHSGCIESWLKDHPTCPLCRTHVSRPVPMLLKAYLFKVRDDMVSYFNNALENVASSIGDCDDS